VVRGNAKDGKKQAPTPRAPSLLRAAQKELARQKLVDAARSAFEANGYVNVTVDDIAQRAGASRGTFYLYFQSKLDALRAIRDELRIAANEAGLLDDLSAMKKPTVEALTTWFERYADYYLEYRQLWPAIRQAQAVEPEFSIIVAEAIDLYAGIWKSTGAVKSDADARLTATLNYTFVDQFMYLWLVEEREGQDVARNKVTKTLAEAIYSTLPH